MGVTESQDYMFSLNFVFCFSSILFSLSIIISNLFFFHMDYMVPGHGYVFHVSTQACMWACIFRSALFEFCQN